MDKPAWIWKSLVTSIDQPWSHSILDRHEAYIRIPTKLPHFDPDREVHGQIDGSHKGGSVALGMLH